MRRLHPWGAALAALLCLPLTALGQPGPPGQPPMMIDPSRMSGIPRPDPEVPAGTLTVRVIQGDFAHPLVGQEVELEGPAGTLKQKVGETQRAVFTGLQAGGTYVARATAFGSTLSSQPVTMPPAPGVKLMLVFPRDEKELIGEPDGKMRSDERLPVGTLEVRVVDENDKPAVKAPVLLARATRGTDKIDQQQRETDAKGTVRFTGLVSSAEAAWALKVLKKDAEVASLPFQLPTDHGAVVGLRSIPVTRDLRQLRVSERSHFIIEIRDDRAQIVENLILENGATSPVDPGPNGLRLPLPAGATGADLLGEGGGSSFQIQGGAVVYKGRIPPGPMELRVGFFLPIEDSAITFRQPTPVSFDQLAFITERFEGMEVEGNRLDKEERTLGGRNFWVVRGPATAAGSEIYFRLTGLPHASPFWRYVAAGVASVILLWAVALGLRRPARAGRRERAQLEERRTRLLDEVAALDAEFGGAAPPDAGKANGKASGAAAHKGREAGKLGRRREQLLSELEQVYRDLDQAV
ncbi:MAG TPA: hypothetical protein VH877_06230 [Polyangia bacterium]|nr:hypothetical protein [Polyangia bacterium]